jgi:CoA-binding domain
MTATRAANIGNEPPSLHYPPYRAVVGEVADGVDDIAHAVPRRTAAIREGNRGASYRDGRHLASQIEGWFVKLADGYSDRFFVRGSDAFRTVLNAGVSLTATVAILSYLFNVELSRAYLLIALPGMTVLGLLARSVMRKQRKAGYCMTTVVAVGHELDVARLIAELRRDQSHGFSVVASCVAVPSGRDEVSGVPVYGGLDDITAAVRVFAADTVAMLPCLEIDGIRLRGLARDLEKTGTGLCVSAALPDVAGPRATIRPRAGLTLLHVDHDHRRLGGIRLVFKDLFDRTVAGAALILLSPLLITLASCGDLAPRPRARAVHPDPGRQGRQGDPDV